VILVATQKGMSFCDVTSPEEKFVLAALMILRQDGIVLITVINNSVTKKMGRREEGIK